MLKKGKHCGVRTVTPSCPRMSVIVHVWGEGVDTMQMHAGCAAGSMAAHPPHETCVEEWCTLPCGQLTLI